MKPELRGTLTPDELQALDALIADIEGDPNPRRYIDRPAHENWLAQLSGFLADPRRKVEDRPGPTSVGGIRG